MSEATKFPLLEAVEEARPESASKPSAGPVYEVKGGRDIPNGLEGVSSLYQLWLRSVDKFPGNNCLGTRSQETGKYDFLSYAEVDQKIQAISGALASLGLGKGARVGIFGANCVEWMVAMQACNRMSYSCVPLYDTLGPTAIEFIMNHAEASVVFVQGAKLKALAKVAPKLEKVLKQVVYWGQAVEEDIAAASAGQVQVSSWDDFSALGEAKPAAATQPGPEDTCTIMYTSGTTGDPKGVVILHKNVLAEITALQRFLVATGFKQDESDVFLSYLPLAHIFDRVAEEFYLSIGATIGYFSGDTRKLTDDLAALKPTLFVGVPRVFERVQTGVYAKMEKAGCLAALLFNYAIRHKKHYMDRGLSQDKASPLFDALVFGKIKAALGGRVKIIISGGAPLSLHVENFLKVAMCAVVVQGYGLTETMAGAAIALPNSSGANVGPPLPGVQMRLESCVELGYDATAYPPRGEVLIRGDIIFSGYYKLDSTTKEVLEPDGWFHTGDIGELLPDGNLKIIDRKKNIFKLSQGEYIAVEKVEAVFSKNDFVEMIWVYGDSFHSALVAVMVPKPSKLMAWAQEKGLDGDLAKVCSSQEATRAVLESLTKTGREGGLHGFEIIKALYLEPEAFDVDKGLMTPTFKFKRPQLLKHYKRQVDTMYAAISSHQ